MIRDLLNSVFGTRKGQNAASVASKKTRTLASINESETTSAKQPRTRRTVGLTEERLRARNKQSWMTSTQGWSNFFGRFTATSKRSR
jgi:hypothetical protein